MIFLGRAMAITLFETLLESDYFFEVKEDAEFKFLKHIRNGATHNNKFNLKHKNGDWSIGEEEAIEWDGIKINRSLQDKAVFNDHISIFGIFLLAKYFSERLYNIDKTRQFL